MNKGKISNYQIGQDTEWGLQDIVTKEIISAEGLIKGTKEEPFQVFPDNKFFATSLDCVAVEIAAPPAKTAYEFYQNIDRMRKYVDSIMPSNIKTVAIAAARLDYKWLQTETANTFGCEKSLNCWTGEEIQPLPTGDNLRSFGFHTHVSYDNPTDETSIELMKAMDLFLGVPSILLEPANERKQVGYGCAGNYRPKVYGSEWRVLSSYFSSEQRLIEWVFHNTELAIEFVNQGRVQELEYSGDVIQRVINHEDRDLAAVICADFNIPY